MNPFDANERHRYIVESGGNPASSADGREKEMWVNSINIDLDTPIYRYMKWYVHVYGKTSLSNSFLNVIVSIVGK